LQQRHKPQPSHHTRRCIALLNVRRTRVHTNKQLYLRRRCRSTYESVTSEHLKVPASALTPLWALKGLSAVVYVMK